MAPKIKIGKKLQEKKKKMLSQSSVWMQTISWPFANN